jgi:cytosine/adenosine deaminase-related metal-dependent hydrolase
LGGPSATNGVVLDIDGDRFASVEMGIAEAPADAVRLPGLTFPGFVNPHFSTLNRVLRGRDRAAHTALRAGILAGITPTLLLDLARATYGELALAGYTTVGEFLGLHHGANGHPYEDPNEISLVLAEAARQAGIRLAIVDVCTLGNPSRTTEQAVHLWVDRLDAFADGLRGNASLRIVAGVDDVESLVGRSLGEMSLWAGQSGLALHARADGLRADGSTTLSALVKAGVLANRGGFTAIGTASATDLDIEALGQQRGSVILDGAAMSAGFAFGALRMAGGRAVGAQSGPGAPDPFSSARSIAENATNDARCGDLRPSELLRALTVDGAASLGWRDSGLLASGQLADLVTVNLTSARLAGSDRDDLLSATIENATPADISHVAVGGKLIVDSGRHTLGNIGLALDTAINAVLKAASADTTLRV